MSERKILCVTLEWEVFVSDTENLEYQRCVMNRGVWKDKWVQLKLGDPVLIGRIHIVNIKPSTRQ